MPVPALLRVYTFTAYHVVLEIPQYKIKFSRSAFSREAVLELGFKEVSISLLQQYYSSTGGGKLPGSKALPFVCDDDESASDSSSDSASASDDSGVSAMHVDEVPVKQQQ